MQLHKLHSWDLTPKEAIDLQKSLANKIISKDSFKNIFTLAGADMAFDKKDNLGFAGIIVYKYPDMTEIERISASGKLEFPYVPGLLTFREAPLLLKAFKKLKTSPDLVIFDGQGIAHPRRIGIASHMGLWLNIPTIGCAKSRLIGDYNEPGRDAGSFEDLYHNEDLIGAVVRTRRDVKPLFISPGHRISVKSAIQITMNCTDGLRIPKPTREADKYVECLKRDY